MRIQNNPWVIDILPSSGHMPSVFSPSASLLISLVSDLEETVIEVNLKQQFGPKYFNTLRYLSNLDLTGLFTNNWLDSLAVEWCVLPTKRTRRKKKEQEHHRLGGGCGSRDSRTRVCRERANSKENINRKCSGSVGVGLRQICVFKATHHLLACP